MSNTGEAMKVAPKQGPASTEERILANALQQFCDFGYNGTSVREITASADVTKPTLYYYFKNKEELFVKLADFCFTKMTEKFIGHQIQPNNFIGNIEGIFKGLQEVNAENPLYLKFWNVISIVPQRGMPQLDLSKHFHAIEGMLSKTLDQAIEDGQCVPERRESVSLMVRSLIVYFSVSLLSNGLYTLGSDEVFKSVLGQVGHCASGAGPTRPNLV